MNIIEQATGQVQAQAARTAAANGAAHTSDAITGYELFQAFYLAVVGVSWFTPWGPSSAAFRETIAALPNLNLTTFWVVCAAVGAVQLVMMFSARFCGWMPFRPGRLVVLTVSMFLHLLMALAWALTGSLPAAVIGFTYALMAWSTLDTVSARSDR